MKLDKIKEFVEYAKSAGVSELKYESGDEKISVKLTGDSPVYFQPQTQAQAVNPFTGASDTSSKQSSKNSGLIEVTSPFVGTFYRSSSPDTDPYVKAGDRVSKGQAMCIVEAMKIMNEIESEADGEIVEICVENETYVEFGQVLFRLKP
ncbi:MAG: acetyl-CoA carboxylase biotin carboxyl carrier protein [Bacteriovoracaceae bacterium]|nr:acetyl-CoA carboxylase biotin carboxyl carrier protein [Bacteriovoracaceae bacterium]